MSTEPGDGLPPAHDPDEFARLSRLACAVVGASFAHILLLDEAGAGELELTATGDAWLDARPELVSWLAEQVISSGRALSIPNLTRPARLRLAFRSSDAGPRAFLGVPLLDLGGTPFGCVCAFQRTVRRWSDADEELLTEIAALIARELLARRETRERRLLENLVRTLGKAVEHMQLGVTVTDLDGRIVYTNPAEARMHGYEVGELEGQHARILGPPELTRALDGRRLDHAGTWTRESVNVRKDGSRFPVLLWSDLVTDADGETLGIVTCCEDITERKRTEQALRDVAMRDHLTGLPNRTHFQDRLQNAISSSREDEASSFAVLFLDLDRFKVVNDSLGHHVGDELLRVVAERIESCLRPNDVVARFGGDEFAVLLEQVREREDAIRITERIQAKLAAPVQLRGYEIYTSASVGIVLGASMLPQPEYLWRSADMAMYRAKAGGTGRYEVFDRAMHADALARLQLETDLRRAVERQEFRLFYQPVIALASGVLVGFEALLRWDHPLRGLIPPTEVIPAAEETGLILPIGEWVLHEAARQLASWHARFDGPPLWIGVNISGKQLSQPNLVAQVEAAIRESGLEPQHLKLEITESAVVENSGIVLDVLRGLKELGVKLFMDDFGTGYSSLSYLHRLPLDALKIDRSFVSRMERGDQHAQLVSSILSLARTVELGAVAEGVSTPDQLALLRELGCEYGQGFLFAPPLALQDAEGLLRHPRSW